MSAPTLSDLLDRYGSPAAIPETALHASGYERVVHDGPCSASTAVQIRRIGAKPPQPPAPPKIVKDGRIVPDKDWGYRPGWAGRGKVRHHA